MVLVGNTNNPTHVYAEVKDNGNWVAFDLVAPSYGETKKYAKKQLLGIIS
jgi:spermidine/putrescine-binding protein